MKRYLPLILTLAIGCRGRAIPPPSPSTPVVLISIDTLRSDHLPAYGFRGLETPNIDALRADSILFSHAYSHVPLTLPSHVSILTGMLPADHGVRDNIGFRLSDSIPTLPELLKKNGYATGAAVSAFVLRRETRISRGFDFFDDDVKPVNGQTVVGQVQRDGEETWRAARTWLDSQGSQPFFFFLHLYDPHTPYTPPEPFFSRYPNHYDGEIAYDDSIVGKLISDLKQRGLYDKSLIILLSDHGEGLNDHGEEEHGLFLYREALQVPLLLKLPHSARAGATVDVPVQLVDVFPTVLQCTATSPPNGGPRAGQSLLTFLNGGPARLIYAESFYGRFHFGWSDLHSLIEGRDHYIDAPQPELYEIAADPEERKNEVQENRRAYLKLRNDIEPFVKQAAQPSNIDPEQAAKLAALGYVGSTAAPAGESLPDPKTKLQAFHDIRQAYNLYQGGEEDAALRLTDQLLKDNGQITDLWDLKTKILWKLGRHQDAIAAAEDGLHRVPGSIALLYDVANLAFAIGDLESAERHAEIAVTIEPGEAHEIMARIAYQRGDSKRAEEQARLALQTAHDPAQAYLVLGSIERDRGDFSAALGDLDRAAVNGAKRGARLQGLHLIRGDVLGRLNRYDEAEREFRAEIDQFPRDPRAYSSLIMLLAIQHRIDDATKVVFAAVHASPLPHTFAIIAETLKAIGDEKGALFWFRQGLREYPNNEELRSLPRRLTRTNSN